MAVKVARLGRALETLSGEDEMTVRKLLSKVGASTDSTHDVRVNGQSVGLDDRVPDESLVTLTPKIVAG